MLGKELVKILTDAIPEKDSWGGAEPYGPYNMDLNRDYTNILYCVTPNYEVVEYFKENNFDLLISHHPMVAGKNVPQMIFHTALDCCKGGLNDMWKEALDIKNAQHFDANLGWYGEIDPISFSDLVWNIASFCGAVEGQTYCKINRPIESVVVCSGLGGLVNDLALKSKADCYILGEALAPAAESGFNALIETGHTNSEWIGVKLFDSLLCPYGCNVQCAPCDIDYYGTEIYSPTKKLYTF